LWTKIQSGAAPGCPNKIQASWKKKMMQAWFIIRSE